jgi:hypothetical protein
MHKAAVARLSDSADTERTMSEENVEIVRRIYSSWGKGEMTAGIEFFDPEISFRSFMAAGRDPLSVYSGPCPRTTVIRSTTPR